MSVLQKAREMYDAFARGDVDGVLDGYHPDIEFREAEGNPYQPDGAPFRGPQEILEKLFMRLGEDWDSFAVTPQTLHQAGDDTVIVEGRYSGVFRATGRKLDAQVCHVLRYEDGKLRSFQQYVDTAQLRHVMDA